MDLLTIHDVKRLVFHDGGPCVSIYLPTHPVGREGMTDELRIRHLFDSSMTRLNGEGQGNAEARNLLERARTLVTSERFLKNRSEGLAVFVSPGLMEIYRLAEPFQEIATVGEHFLLKPLFAHTEDNRLYFILTLSQKQVRLYEASPLTIREIRVPGMPEGIQDALDQVCVDRGLQVHSGARTNLGKQSGVFHGQGGKPDAAKADLVAYCREVNTALDPILHDSHLPLVTVAVASVGAVFAEHCNYPHLLPTNVDCNADHLSKFELHQRTWPVAEHSLDEPRRIGMERLKNAVGTDWASTQISEILRAANEGRVDTIFVNRHAQRWGTFDATTQAVDIHSTPAAKDDELLDLAMQLTIRHRGEAYVVRAEEIPEGGEVAALYRY